MPLINSVYNNINTATIGMTSDVVVPQMVALNSTVQNVLSLPVIDSSLTCIVDGLDNVPSTGEIMAPVASLNASIQGIKQGANGLVNAINTMTTQKNAILADTATLQATTNQLSTSLNTLNNNLAAVDAAIVPIQNAQNTLLVQNTLVAPTNQGLIDIVSNAVAALEPGASATNRVPLASEILVVTGPSPAGSTLCDPAGSDGSACPSLNDIIGGTLNNNVNPNNRQVTNQNTLKTSLSTMNDRLVNGSSGFPSYNYSLIADAAAQMNSIAADLQNTLIPALLNAITTTEATINAMPTSANVSAQVTNLHNDVNAFSFAPVFSSIDTISSSITSLSSGPNGQNTILQVVALLDRVKAVSSIIPCAQAITNQLLNVNASLVQIPQAALDAFNTIDNANATINNALSEVVKVQNALVNANSQIAAFDVASQRAQVVNANVSLSGALSRFNFNNVQSSLSNMPGKDTPVNFTLIKANLNSLSAQLANTGLNATTISTIRNVQTLKMSISSNLVSLINDLTAVIANGGVYKCSNSATTCTQDSDCSGTGAYCMPSVTAAGAAKVGLDALSTATNQDLSATTVVASLAAMKSAAQGVNTATYRSNIASAQASIAAVDTSRMSTELGNVAPGFAQFDTAALTNQLNDVTAKINGAGVNDLQPQLDQLNSTLKMVKQDARGAVVDVQALLQSVQNFVNVKLKSYQTNELSSSRLNLISATQGYGSLLYAILAVADDAANTILSTQLTSSYLSGLLPAPISLASKTLFGYDQEDINKLTASGVKYGVNRRYGLINWAVHTLPQFKSLKTIQSNDTRSYGVFHSVYRQRYSGNGICLRDNCIAASVNTFAVDEPIGTAADELASAGYIPDPNVPADVEKGTETIKLSWVKAINAVLWIFPSFIIFWGLIGLLNKWLCNCCCCRRPKGCCCNAKNKPKWEKCPYGCMTGCVLFQIPICFVLAGLFFPAMMVFGDVCASGKNVGYSALLQIGSNPQSVQSICKNLPSSTYSVSGTGAAAKGLCSIAPTVTLPSGAVAAIVNATISLETYTKALLGQGTCSSTGTPWQPTFEHVANNIRTLPYKEVRYLLTDPNSPLNSQVKLRPAMLNFIYGATNATANLLATTFVNLAQDVATCDALNNAIAATTDTVCCNVVTPLYWLASVFFLLAWAMCCCGLPVGLLARKRLVSKPWGSQMRQRPPTGCCGAAKPDPAEKAASASNWGRTSLVPTAGAAAMPAAAAASRRRPSAAGRYPLSSEPPAAIPVPLDANANYGGWGPMGGAAAGGSNGGVISPDGVGLEMASTSTAASTTLVGGQSFFGTSPLYTNHHAQNPMTAASSRTPASAPGANSFAPTAAGGSGPRNTLAASGITYSVFGFNPGATPTEASAPPAYAAAGAGAGAVSTAVGVQDPQVSSRKLGFAGYKGSKKEDVLQTPAAAASTSSRNLSVPRPSLSQVAAAEAARAAAIVSASGVNPVGPGSPQAVNEAARLSPSAGGGNTSRSPSAPGSPARPAVEENPSPLIAAGVVTPRTALTLGPAAVAAGSISGSVVDIDSAAFTSPGFGGAGRK
jgi:hypothetical protein